MVNLTYLNLLKPKMYQQIWVNHPKQKTKYDI